MVERRILYLWDAETEPGPREILCETLRDSLRLDYDLTERWAILPKHLAEEVPEDRQDQVMLETDFFQEGFDLLFIEGHLRLEEPGRGKRFHADVIRRFIEEGGVVVFHCSDALEFFDPPGPTAVRQFFTEAGFPPPVVETGEAPTGEETARIAVSRQTTSISMASSGYVEATRDSDTGTWIIDPENRARLERPSRLQVPVDSKYRKNLSHRVRDAVTEIPQICVEAGVELDFLSEERGPHVVTEPLLFDPSYEYHEEGFDHPVWGGYREWNHGFACLLTGNICDDRLVEDGHRGGLQFTENLIEILLELQEEKVAEPAPRYERVEAGTDLDAPVPELVEQGEGDRIEFKATAFRDLDTKKPNTSLVRGIAKSVAAFMNKTGGVVLIGVEDDGSPRGIRWDWKVLGGEAKRTWDHYQLHLGNKLEAHLGKEALGHVEFRKGKLDQKLVCRLHVEPRRTEPVWIDDKLYIRRGSSNKPLTGQEAVRYRDEKFPG